MNKPAVHIHGRVDMPYPVSSLVDSSGLIGSVSLSTDYPPISEFLRTVSNRPGFDRVLSHEPVLKIGIESGRTYAFITSGAHFPGERLEVRLDDADKKSIAKLIGSAENIGIRPGNYMPLEILLLGIYQSYAREVAEHWIRLQLQ